MPLKKSEIYSTLWEACNKLRGGVEPARYKDYVLVLLFFKYVSDKYTSNDPFARFQVSPDSSFDELVNAKGKKDIGERVNKIIRKFLENNGLSDSLPEVNFNNQDELGSGKELVDKLSGLIGTFQNLDFSSNRASGDDIIGDAYEYFMTKFAQESGKSKGQFYTPSEVSRVIARLLGIENIKTTSMKLYDPCAGSGSLLIRAADESPVDEDGQSLISIYAQEKDNSTAGLAKMNFILHTKGSGEIKKGNTLSDPKFIDSFGQLERFDFIVMNPPFSDKSWSDGVNTQEDIYHRFDGFGVPPAKNGDYAWLLHVVKSLTNNGKAGIVMPHGVLFRGNAEEIIRINLLKTRYIKGVVSLPQNLFYGAGIPACLIFIDKENAEKRRHIFFIDASDGFKKDGNKNRLREQDIEKIVRVYKAQEEIPGYSRLVPYSEILDKNGGNMNVPRYIQKPDETLPQNIEAHLHGGIPKHDIDSLVKIWKISPGLMKKVFYISGDEIYRLILDADGIGKVFEEDEALRAQKSLESIELFTAWKEKARDKLLNITEDINPKILISGLGESILNDYNDAKILDKYSVFDCLMNYWNEILQDDVYAIMSGGYEAGRGVSYQYDLRGKLKAFDGELIPREIIEHEYFADEAAEIDVLAEKMNGINAEIDELRENLEADEEDEESRKKLSELQDELKALMKESRKKRKGLDELVLAKYKDLTVDEIKSLLFDRKWTARLSGDINGEIESVLNACVSRLVMIAKRYGRTLGELEADTQQSGTAVRKALEGMGYQC